MAGWGSKGGGGGTVDTEARALAQQANDKLGVIYKVAGDKVKPNDEVFILLDDGSVVNFANYGKKILTIPTPATKTAIIAAGFSLLASGSVDTKAIIQAWQTERTAWTVDGMVDFTAAEPANTAANHGNLYLSLATGAGSISKGLTFDKDDLYEMQDDGTWREYLPKDGWTLTHQNHEWQYYNAKWNAKISFDHSHDRILNKVDALLLKGGKLWLNKVSAPDYTIEPTDAKWLDNWVELKTGGGTGLDGINNAIGSYYLLANKLDFTTNEPVILANSLSQGKYFLNTATGLGSLTPAKTYNRNSLYTIVSTTVGNTITDSWGEIVPKNGDVYYFNDEEWQFLNGEWQKRQGYIHQHWRLSDYSTKTHFIFHGKKIYINKVENPRFNLNVSDSAFLTDWEEYIIRQNITVSGNAIMSDWQPSTAISKNSLFRVMLGKSPTNAASVESIITSNYAFTTSATFDQAELTATKEIGTKNKYAFIGQDTIPNWRPKMEVMAGMQLKMNGFLGQYLSTKLTADHMDFQEQIQFLPLATASTGVARIVYQVKHGFKVGQWLTQTLDDGYVLGQPNDLALLETAGVVTYIISTDSFILESSGGGADPYNTDNDTWWDYDPGTIIYLAKDGGVTDVKPKGVPYRKLGKVTEPGYGLIEQSTVFPSTYVPNYTSWPSNELLRKSLDDGGVSAFVYTGTDTNNKIGLYYNSNAGIDPTAKVSKPVKL